MLLHAILLAWLIQAPHGIPTQTVIKIPECRPPPFITTIPTENALRILKKNGQSELLWFSVHPSGTVVYSVYWNPISGAWTALSSGVAGWSCKSLSSERSPNLPPSPYKTVSR